MKAYLFIEKEVKIPTEGDWFMNPDNDIYQARLYETERLPILTRHEIEIPEGATVLHCWPGNILSAKIHRFPIPGAKKKVKKKVKKTVYLHVQNFNGKTVYSVHDGPTAPAEAYPVEIEVEE